MYLKRLKMEIRTQFGHIRFSPGPSNRPDWGIFDHIFPDSCFLSVELRMINFNARKTGLFKPVWLANLMFDHPYLPIKEKPLF